jgi:hypothetical protein
MQATHSINLLCGSTSLFTTFVQQMFKTCNATTFLIQYKPVVYVDNEFGKSS